MKIFLSILLFSLSFIYLNAQSFVNDFNSTGLPLGNSASYIGEIIDFNNDNFEDIIYRSDSSGVLITQLYVNNGNGTFSNVAQFNIGGKLEFYSSPNSPGWTKTFDFNSDGFIDIVCQQEDTLRFFKNNEGTGNFTDVTTCLGFDGDFIPKTDYSRPQRRLEPIYLSDVDEDDDIDILFGRYDSDGILSLWMFENKLSSDGSFNNLVELIPGISTGGSISVIVYDFDNDSHEDIFMNLRTGSVYTSYPVLVFKNNGNLSFTNITSSTNIGSTNSWGFANVNDLNNDGTFDLIVGSTDANQPNRVLLNNGNGTFSNNATVLQNGVGNYYYPRSFAIDYDNDMDLDINWEGSGFGFPGAPLLTNNGNLTFSENANALNLKFNQSTGNQNNSGQIDWMDVNNDGRLDHFRSRGNSAAPKLMINNVNNGNNYLRIKLKECSENANAIGSVVELFCLGNTFAQSNFGGVIQTQGGSSSDIFHFGLGGNSIVDSIIVKWSNGENSILYNIPTNQLITIEENANCQNQLTIFSVSTFNDVNESCIQESTELGVPNVNVTIEPMNLVGVTDESGQVGFPMLIDGTYTATIDTTNLNWYTSCPVSQEFTIVNGEIDCIDFGLINDNPCTDPDVSIFAPSLRRCFSNRLVYVSACNQVTATGILDSSYVDVELDPLLTVNSASLPYTDLGNNTFRFETGDIYPGQCVNFTLSTTVSCDAQNGQTLCMDATLYPAEDCIFDSIPSDPITNDGIGGTLDGLPGPCTLPWDKSSLQVEGWCQGDSVYFSITNTGDFGDGDMECYSPVWLTVDGVVTDTDSLQIQGGETVIYSYPASGQTFILNASQHPLHPGNSAPNAHVELCGDSTNWTPGIINQFPQDDADPDVDIFCGQVTAPVDPNDKTGYPLGQTEEYYIQPNQQLQYVIRFQNVGTDTAFTVVVRDTLDIDLNIFTVTPGVASDPYTFKMYGPRVLEWTFEDIQLPDSTTNSEGSNGFLTFHVEQVPDLAPGTVINNDADIYFDFELPITTNTTVHKIYEGFVEVLNIEDLTIEGKDIFIYPNPTTNLITIQSESLLNNKFKIYDQQGREVMNGKLTGKNTEVSLGKLSRGTYTIQVDGNYKPAVIIKQ